MATLKDVAGEAGCSGTVLVEVFGQIGMLISSGTKRRNRRKVKRRYSKGRRENRERWAYG